MEPIEINAGLWYLRELRNDDRMSDVAAVVESAADPQILLWCRRPAATPEAAAAHIAARTTAWAAGTACSWAVCEITTGDMLGEVCLSHLDLSTGNAVVEAWVLERARRSGLATTALGAVLKFAFAPSESGGLGLGRVTVEAPAANEAASRLVQKLGFHRQDPLGPIWVLDSRHLTVDTQSGAEQPPGGSPPRGGSG